MVWKLREILLPFFFEVNSLCKNMLLICNKEYNLYLMHRRRNEFGGGGAIFLRIFRTLRAASVGLCIAQKPPRQ